MSVGNSGKYKLNEIAGRHFVETGKKAGLGPTVIGKVIREVLEYADEVPRRALARMPKDFAAEIYQSVSKAMNGRLGLLESGLSEL